MFWLPFCSLQTSTGFPDSESRKEAAAKFVYSAIENCCGALMYFFDILPVSACHSLVSIGLINALVSIMLEASLDVFQQEDDNAKEDSVSLQAARCLLCAISLGEQISTPIKRRLSALDVETRLDLLACLSRVHITEKTLEAREDENHVNAPCLKIDSTLLFSSSIDALEGIGFFRDESSSILWNELRVKYTSIHDSSGVDEGGFGATG